MSDDDAIYGNFLDNLIPFLRKEEKAGVLYAPCIYENSGKKDRIRSKSDFRIFPNKKNASKYIYDAILFSGLIFRKDYVTNFDASRFKNYNYFQIYLFLQMLLKYGGYYFAQPSVLCIGDGENAYGLSESSGGNPLLANRKSVKSNLEFHKTLIKTIQTFDKDEETNIMASFMWQYSLRSISGLAIARKEGKQYFQEYWAMLNSLDIHLYPIAKCYYFLLLILGTDITNAILYPFKKLIKRGN